MSHICSICHDDFSEECGETYILPECAHKYHVNCIMHWFRTGKNACPLCQNKGINNEVKDDYMENNAHIENYKTLRRQVKSKNTSLKLVKDIEKLKKLENDYKQLKETNREWKKEVEWNKLQKIQKKFWMDKWKLEKNIRIAKIRIGMSYNTKTNIIIATRVNISESPKEYE